MTALLSRLVARLQFLLPKYWLTAAVYRISRIRTRAVKNALIRGFVRWYAVELDDVDQAVPEDFASFNEFFIRPLRDGARPVDGNAASIVSPVDGTVSLAGTLDNDRLLQAKGIDYTLDDLLAIDLPQAREFTNGVFATIYLAPYNYHRVHMPFDGELVDAHYVPGDLFSVNEATASVVDGLYRRNERLNLHFRTGFGRAALIFVGALNVGSISTPWTGEIRPRKRGVVEVMKLDSAPRQLAKGDLLGWFNMGSTVILLLPDGSGGWSETLLSGKPLVMGETIGTLTGAGGD